MLSLFGSRSPCSVPKQRKGSQQTVVFCYFFLLIFDKQSDVQSKWKLDTINNAIEHLNIVTISIGFQISSKNILAVFSSDKSWSTRKIQVSLNLFKKVGTPIPYHLQVCIAKAIDKEEKKRISLGPGFSRFAIQSFVTCEVDSLNKF